MKSKTPAQHEGGLHAAFHFIHRLPASDRLVFHILLAVIIASAIWFLLSWSQQYTESVPVAGGTLIEGVVGTPRFINPVLATSRVDRDLTALIYSGVLKLDQDGQLVPDLASEITQNDDGTRYSIRLKQDNLFHDGRPVTAADVVFTYQLLQDADLKSHLRGNWSNVVIERIDTFELVVELSEPYAPFIENLTVGILPQHIWREIPIAEIPASTINTRPVGSGPYSVKSVERSDIGAITAYQLEKVSTDTQIENIIVRIFRDQTELLTSLREGSITSTAMLSTATLHEFSGIGYNITSAPLPRSIAILFNQNRSEALRNTSVRNALEASLNRDEIVTAATNGFAIPNASPVPVGYGMLESIATSSPTTTEDRIAVAQTILINGGWEQNEDGVWERESSNGTTTLAITLRTINQPDLAAATENVADQWRQLGVEVRVEQYELGDMTNSIIRPRDFEAILFGMDVSRSVDLYPFWHSSQQSDPGYNLSQYANIRTDRLLEEIRRTSDNTIQSENLSQFVEILAEEKPAIFLYTPTLQYVTKDIITSSIPAKLQGQHDRFQTITSWHMERDNLWPIFYE